jgi:hypothetical protein
MDGAARGRRCRTGAFCLIRDFDRALALLEKLMAQSYADSITPALLRMDPVWNPIRKNPRFQKLAGGQRDSAFRPHGPLAWNELLHVGEPDRALQSRADTVTS